jgi:hypothetical protein
MPAKDPAAVALGRKGGQAKVSKGPTKGMTPEEKQAWAAKLVAARKAKKVLTEQR